MELSTWIAARDARADGDLSVSAPFTKPRQPVVDAISLLVGATGTFFDGGRTMITTTIPTKAWSRWHPTLLARLHAAGNEERSFTDATVEAVRAAGFDPKTIAGVSLLRIDRDALRLRLQLRGQVRAGTATVQWPGIKRVLIG
jgi:hypothetical protein